MNFVIRYLKNILKLSNTGTLKNLTGQNTGGQLTLFPPQTPASPLVLPGSAEARQMTATSGRRLLGLYERLNRPMSFSRMFLGSSVWHSRLLHLTWRQKDTQSNRLLFQLAPLGRGTGETGYGLLPTPDASQRGARTNQNNHQITLQDVIAAKTPEAQDIAKIFPTPQSRDYRTGEGHRWENTKERSRNLNDKVAHDQGYKLIPTPQTQGLKECIDGKTYPLKGNGQLNPTWVEWLMGYPLGWTDLNQLETV